ncbi:septum formation initiator family protein [Mesorhizobium sp. BAC0120]|uniref:FtsB family cell division protein n=1 Tax=Mesorhizobium sp. BAC0120 TaxID=3090670 RepID=UPI00298BD731|nr:septum formation initiator family protein [Mesorhizobium sp. BAC0120]MDW6022848.1 septum formation initiator family protein [Mesorhizobium sp. BAC0120]
MWTRQHKNRNTGRLIVPAISALFLAYFGFHAYHGEFGINSKYQLEAQALELNEELAAIKAQRLELERRVQLMHDGTLEKDMLDEQARRSLNVSHSDEITIMLDPAAAN